MQVVLTTIEPSKTRQDLSYDAYEYTVSVLRIIRKLNTCLHCYPYVCLSLADCIAQTRR